MEKIKYCLRLIIIGIFATVILFAQSPLPEDPEVTKIADGFQFTEGPVWKKGIGLLFSDIPANTVYQWTKESGIEIYLKPSGNSNGLALDLSGDLLLAQHGKRSISRSKFRERKTLVEQYEGKTFNSPNDVDISSNGTIYFTDPAWSDKELGFSGIFSLSKTGEINLLNKSLDKPNGIKLSPDESKLYVSDTFEGKVWVWDIVDESTIENKRLLVTLENGNVTVDGMEIDQDGNLYIAGQPGVWKVSPEGEVQDTFEVPNNPTNCAWGKDKEESLYVTTHKGEETSSVYKLTISNQEVEKIAGDFKFTEGPVWKEGTGLLFSDIDGNTIYKWTKEDGLSKYLKQSKGANGLAIDGNGDVVMAQQHGRKISKLVVNKQQVLISEYNNKKLNSPNDLTVKSDGTIFFTDPPYGIDKEQEELGYYGIYSITPDGNITLLDKTLNRPNGIELSPDENKLYVTDSGENKIYVWDLIDNSSVENKQLLTSIEAEGRGGTDGMKIGKKGNLFVAGPIGIWVISPEGEIMDTVDIEGQTTNCAWNKDSTSLYVTSEDAVYKIEMDTDGSSTNIRKNESGHNNQFKLKQNYPNPFNTSTKISFIVKEDMEINLGVFNIKGQEIENLIRDRVTKGNYEIKWNASDYSSGIYFFRLVSNQRNEVQKCIYQK